MNSGVTACSRKRRLSAIALVAGATALFTPRAVSAQKGGCSDRHPMVDAVSFKGTHVVPVAALSEIIVTYKSSFRRRFLHLPYGVLTCLDSLEVVRDAQRIREEYAERGYPGTGVTLTIAHKGTRRAQVTFTMKESAPVLIDSLSIAGIPPEAANVTELRKEILARPYDPVLLAAIRDSVQNLILAAGYARAVPPDAPTVTVDTARRRAEVALNFAPGKVIFVGAINVKITPTGAHPALDTSTVRRLLRIKPGDRYSSRAVAASQRDLFETELYRAIRIDEGVSDTALTTMPLNVTLAEAARHRMRVGGGWGTLDCFRTQVRFVDQNAFSSGNRLELNGKLSKIGLASPFTGLAPLCTSLAREDPFSKDLNYYIGSTIAIRGLLGLAYRPAITVYSERRSEFQVYEQTTDIGVIASVTRDLGTRLTGSLQYQFVDGRTIADGAVSCVRFGFCRVVDLASFRLSSPIHTVSLVFAKNPLLPVDDPESGYRWQVELRQGYTNIARTLPLNFTRALGEVAVYTPLGANVVLALRAQLGYVSAPSDVAQFLPPQERFYAGGQNSVRGYNENVLGPGSYIVPKYTELRLNDSTKVGVANPDSGYSRLAPSGGNAMWVANAELRLRHLWPGEWLRWVLFVDAGRVWNTNDVFSSLNADARITPGFGVRIATPIGPFRVDVGYNGYALDPGPAFFILNADPSKNIVGRAICVSPGTTDPLVLAPGQVGATSCPANFTPKVSNSLISRLAFHFSIGNAF